METTEKVVVTIEAKINAPAEKVWNTWNDPQHVVKWNSPTPEWHTPRAENDVRTGGRFMFRMEARDGSMGFDFGGVYDVVTPYTYMEYTMGDGRKVKIFFHEKSDCIHIVQSFDAENQNPVEMQRAGWQSILDNFKKYTESL